MKASTKRILSIGLSGILFIAALVIYANLIQPEFGRVNEKRTEVFSKAKKFNDQKAAIEEVQKLIAKFRGPNVRRAQETIGLAMPLSPYVTQILAQVQAIARSSQTDLVSFAVTPLSFEPSRSPLVRRLGILKADVSVQGPYEGLKNFLRALETNVRVFNVKQVQISAGQRAGSAQAENFYTGKITAEVYYQEGMPYAAAGAEARSSKRSPLKKK